MVLLDGLCERQYLSLKRMKGGKQSNTLHILVILLGAAASLILNTSVRFNGV